MPIKLIGYSSDDLPGEAMRFGKPVKSRHDRIQEFDDRIKQGLGKDYSKHIENTHWFKEPEPGIIYFVYKVNGELRYYVREQAILTLKGLFGKNVSKQGIYYQGSDVKYVSGQNKKFIKSNTCCYCEVELTETRPPSLAIPTTQTKEHLFPRHAGGKNGGNNIRLACFECNQQKGGLMLHSYIQLLNMEMLDKSGPDLIKLQTKIKNANFIAKQIES